MYKFEYYLKIVFESKWKWDRYLYDTKDKIQAKWKKKTYRYKKIVKRIKDVDILLQFPIYNKSNVLIYFIYVNVKYTVLNHRKKILNQK